MRYHVLAKDADRSRGSSDGFGWCAQGRAGGTTCPAARRRPWGCSGSSPSSRVRRIPYTRHTGAVDVKILRHVSAAAVGQHTTTGRRAPDLLAAFSAATTAMPTSRRTSMASRGQRGGGPRSGHVERIESGDRDDLGGVTRGRRPPAEILADPFDEIRPASGRRSTPNPRGRRRSRAPSTEASLR